MGEPHRHGDGVEGRMAPLADTLGGRGSVGLQRGAAFNLPNQERNDPLHFNNDGLGVMFIYPPTPGFFLCFLNPRGH